ncbi:hypothetical protein SERLA73DRAFT_183442 [Serpula lacrymans var. lacrymans S7.3]|uniref:Mur ligase central domain-containing protein n=2 Tax=Serpula lacrymans var. lacrymans TaxID=341189 RepID=F8PZW4_SERL3|nr:uncharacterized protein SERLADRAFT_470633 [Serpula lacrymans var. lacrymans S7.9]EGN98436.1 hypothetical protein SERLA73DRAFT_183442 [Serpula lacrymans var. lacrymans S7.3]EGO24015.1 hypothetical protein SERLADRAFT_470633 [Serpula lacrymans var. lacrymans S7.9]
MSIDLTLDRVRLLASHLPQFKRLTCHIAGTNGKGSVSSILSSILHSVFTVGRYNSPHLVSIYDCITINNKPISPATYAAARKEVEEANDRFDTKASSFELLTLTALLIFERAKLDVVVIEVGLGGRLDATNIIPDDAILVSALASVDLDHQAFLGSTVEAIAKEKAGIARKDKPFVMGVQKHAGVEQVVRSTVSDVGGDFISGQAVQTRPWDESIDGPESRTFSLSAEPFKKPPAQPISFNIPVYLSDILALFPLHGRHQLDNLGLALSVVSTILTHPSCRKAIAFHIRCEFTMDTIARGIASTSWPGRLSFHTIGPGAVSSHFQQITRPLHTLVDGAHNPASSAALGSYVSDLVSLATRSQAADSQTQAVIRLTYVLSLSDSPPKTPKETLTPLFDIKHPAGSSLQLNVAVLRFTPPEGMPWVKSVSPALLRDTICAVAPGVEVWCAGDDEDPRSGSLVRALAWAAGRGEGNDVQELVIVAGSLYLVADFYRLLGAGTTV